MPPPLAVVVHGHFYQPPRENPWTEQVPREPSAAPWHDWNERIARESYRPNAFARVFDDAGRISAVVNNYEHLSFDVGPTLLSWLETHAPEAYEKVLEGDAKGGGAMAQAFFHVILPLSPPEDVRTLVRWGVAEFCHRFGRRPEGIWLPETAVNDAVLAVLAEEQIAFTILAPGQAARVRPLPGNAASAGTSVGAGDPDEGWSDVSGGRIDTRRPYRWLHPDGSGRGVDLVFYDGALSHAVAFELGSLSSEALVDRIAGAGSGGGLVTVAADGETFGHHHRWGDRLLAYALAIEAPRRGMDVTTVAGYLRRVRPEHQVEVVESAWSCAHGVGRWKEDCGCHTGGAAGWNQQWRAPLRSALDLVRDALAEIWDRRAPAVLHDPAQARDAYVEVLLGSQTAEEFAARQVKGDQVEAFTLLEAQRHQLAMYTSCGWFFNDLAGLETVQVLRYAARVLDLIEELGEPSPRQAVLAVLATAHSNDPNEGDGRSVWRRHVEPVRVDADRVVAHVALLDLLEAITPSGPAGCFEIEVLDHAHDDRGSVAICTGRVVVSHRRTQRRVERVYAAVHLGGLEVLGALRPAGGDPSSDRRAADDLRAAFEAGAPITTLLRTVADRFGPREFGLADALPDAAEEILRRAGRTLADRFAAAYERLFSDHRATLIALAQAGYPLPAELRAPAELALARRLEAEVAAHAGSLDPADHQRAIATAREARASGFRIDTPAAAHTVERLLVAACDRAVREPSTATAAIDALALAAELGLSISLDRAQEIVHAAISGGTRPDARLTELARALGLAV